MTVDDLETQAIAAQTDEFEPDEQSMFNDILDSLDLLRKCMHLLDYLSDPDLCKSVTKRERDTMARLSESVDEFLDDAETKYEEVQE